MKPMPRVLSVVAAAAVVAALIAIPVARADDMLFGDSAGAGTALSLSGGTMTGPILEAAGNATSPSYSFSSSTHQGMYSVTTTRLGFGGGGSVLELDIDNGLRKITAVDALLVASTGTSPAVDVAPSGSTAVGINMRSDNLTKLFSFGQAGTEHIGGYEASSSPTLVVNQHGGTSPALQVGGALVQPPTAVTITSPTDVASLGFQACSFCKMSSSGVAAWTPQETSAVAGMNVCFQNTGANVITMTAAANVYVGPGSAVGQNDIVCMVYTDSPTTEWIQTNFFNNP